MLSSSNLKSEQADSYFEQDDYYSKEEGPGGSRWLGEGAKKLGLEGGVEKKDFSQLLKGYSPGGDRLFSREIDQKKRRAATDFTFSAPKSVSVAGLVQGDERVIEAHHFAVERSLAVLEERYAETRITTSTGRKKIGTGNIIAAVFAHGTSREAEPQLHSHCVVMNATQAEGGQWYGLLNDSAIAHKKLLGQIYQNELAIELQKLGYEIEQRDHGQFDIKGYSSELLETFSTRRGQIEALVSKWKGSGKIVRDAGGHPINADRLLYEAATLKTRKVKPQIVEAGKLLQSWKAVLALKGLSLPELPSQQATQLDASETVVVSPAVDGSASAQIGDSPEPKAIIDDAIAHCGERDAIFEPQQIEKFVFEHHIGTHSIVDLQLWIEKHPELISVGMDEKGKAKVTTETALQLELSTIRLMCEGQAAAEAIASETTVSSSFENSTLSDEQRQAIADSCAATDRIIGWQGSAGAGKTYGLNAFKQIAEAHGYAVSGYAPSSAAAHELGESLHIQTETVARLLLSEAEEAAAQKRLWLVDEAGLLSMRDAHALLTKAQTQNARVVLVGDTKQLSSVEAGNPFKSLQAGGMQTYHLDETRRQKTAELRQAVQLVAAGQVAKSIGVLQSAGYISEIEKEGDRIMQMAKDFLSLTAAERSETLVLAGTNQNRLCLTGEIRAGLQRTGSLGDDAFTMRSLQRKDLTAVQGRYARNYSEADIIAPIRDYKRQRLIRNQRYVVRAVDAVANLLTLETPEGTLIQIDPKACERKAVYTLLAEPIAVGDRLKWTKNNRVEETRNGQAFTVTAISSEGIAQTIDDDGSAREVDLSGYQHVDYAWIATTYSSQGKTADRVMALMDAATVNKEAFYVATSRAKNDLRLYAADVGQLRELAEKTRANENVSDYIPLFELTEHEQPLSEQSSPAADHARAVTADVGRSVDHWQRAATRSHQSEQPANSDDGSGTSGYVAEFSGLPQNVERHIRQVKRRRQVVRVGEADLPAHASVEQLQRRADADSRVSNAAARLNEQVEQAARSRQSGSRWPRIIDRPTVKKPELKAEAENVAVESALSAPAPIVTPEPVELKPPAPEASLAQQLDEFTGVLGYAPGDRLYVRALLPKNLSDEMAVSRRLKFEIEENGKKRLIPNTRRGYLTVGSWEFTHIRKDKEPAVYSDGLAVLTELNKEGRGIYFVVNPGGEKDGDISGARSLFWENDDRSKLEQMERARTSGLPLGAVVETNKSIHCYSPLSEPLQDLDAWKQLQERLIQKMESDPAIRNRSRLMRLPGFDHVRVEAAEQVERLVFTPVTLRHIDRDVKGSVEEMADKLPAWKESKWTKTAKSRKGKRHRHSQNEAVAPTLAVDNPWDIRNFAQYLNGDQHLQNGWLQVQCPEHGGDGHSGNSLHINEQTGQYKCHGGCDSQAVYTAAWKLAQSQGWEPPQKQEKSIPLRLQTDKPLVETQPVVEEPTRKPTRWQRYSNGTTAPPGRKRDFQIARKAFADGLSKKQVITLLAKNSPKAQKLYRDEGSMPAYHYVEMVAKAAQRASQQPLQKQPKKGIEH